MHCMSEQAIDLNMLSTLKPLGTTYSRFHKLMLCTWADLHVRTSASLDHRVSQFLIAFSMYTVSHQKLYTKMLCNVHYWLRISVQANQENFKINIGKWSKTGCWQRPEMMLEEVTFM